MLDHRADALVVGVDLLNLTLLHLVDSLALQVGLVAAELGQVVQLLFQSIDLRLRMMFLDHPNVLGVGAIHAYGVVGLVNALREVVDR